MIKGAALFTLLLSIPLVLSSCLHCADCTNCAKDYVVVGSDTMRSDTSICYREAKSYYQNRKEWRQDVKAYEAINQCDCK